MLGYVSAADNHCCYFCLQSVRGVKRDGTVPPADPAGRKRLKVRFKDETEAVEAVDPRVGVHKNQKAARVGGCLKGPLDAEAMSGANKVLSNAATGTRT